MSLSELRRQLSLVSSRARLRARSAALVSIGAIAALGGALPAQAHRSVNSGGVRAEGRYAVVFPLSAALPDPRLTPGALNPRVDQGNLRQTICRRGGYTRSIRPAEDYTERLKRRQIAEYAYTDRRLRDYEEDHYLCRLGRRLRKSKIS